MNYTFSLLKLVRPRVETIENSDASKDTFLKTWNVGIWSVKTLIPFINTAYGRIYVKMFCAEYFRCCVWYNVVAFIHSKSSLCKCLRAGSLRALYFTNKYILLCYLIYIVNNQIWLKFSTLTFWRLTTHTHTHTHTYIYIYVVPHS